MFRKKADAGAITVLDEDENALQRDQLGLTDPNEAVPSDQQIDNMTSAELRRLALSSANFGKDSTARALRMATEAREIGANTATTMQQQTTQLEKLSDDIEVVHDYLDKSERTIEKMTKTKVARLFQRKKASGKGLSKVKGTRKEQEQRDELRNKGLESVDMQAMQTNTGSVSMRDLNNGNSGGGDDGDEDASSSSRRKLFSRKKETVAPVETRAVEEDYSGYSEDVAQVLREQDEDLDKIGDALSDMKAMAGAMNHELEYQDKLINEVQDFSSETSRRTKDNARKIAKIK